jgi:hypothetical protein
MPQSEREEGWYWVYCCGEWIVAQWESSSWRECGLDIYFADDGHHIERVGERITRDGK